MANVCFSWLLLAAVCFCLQSYVLLSKRSGWLFKLNRSNVIEMIRKSWLFKLNRSNMIEMKGTDGLGWLFKLNRSNVIKMKGTDGMVVQIEQIKLD